MPSDEKEGTKPTAFSRWLKHRNDLGPRWLEENWYHTIELGNGLISNGVYDHRQVADRYGLPESLKGQSALDVGTQDGFWAFEMERRGADRVVAIDVEHWGDFDWLPWVKESLGPEIERRSDRKFTIAHAMRDSHVEHKVCSVYDLSPELAGTFDVVFCGSLLLHLQNPLKALVNICSVTNGMAIVATLLDKEIDDRCPDKPWISFGHRGPEPRLGDHGIYWHFSTRALQEIMEYAGFVRTQPLAPAAPPGHNLEAVVIGYPD
jgi:tRNA (mo5U34)-methyltransferase